MKILKPKRNGFSRRPFLTICLMGENLFPAMYKEAWKQSTGLNARSGSVLWVQKERYPCITGDEENGGYVEDWLAGNDREPEHYAIAAELHERMMPVLEKMEPEDREILILRFGLKGTEMSSQELAEMRGISEQAISKRLQKAVSALIHRYKATYGESLEGFFLKHFEVEKHNADDGTRGGLRSTNSSPRKKKRAQDLAAEEEQFAAWDHARLEAGAPRDHFVTVRELNERYLERESTLENIVEVTQLLARLVTAPNDQRIPAKDRGRSMGAACRVCCRVLPEKRR